VETPGSEVNLESRSARGWLGRVLGRLLPPRCALCSAALQDSPAPLCAGCRGELADNLPCCPRCAEPLARAEPACGPCLQRPPPFAGAFAGFRYAWPLDGLITRFKFGGDLAAGRALALLLAERVRAASPARPDLLVPVPLHDDRLRRRGHDQALELARDLGRTLALPVAPDLLRRTRATAAQTELDAVARRRNVRAAFQVQPRALARARTAGHRRLVLVDDVMTTGATLAECARTLQQAGFDRVEVWVVARAARGPH